MSYQLRMHNEVRDWLTGLRDTEPGLARLAGEAVLALLDAGGALGPPLVVPLESVLREAVDPREALDLSYQRQLETLTQVRRGVADVATSRKRIELQVNALEQQAAKLTSQREEALKAGREDLAEEARAREAGVQEQLAELRGQYLVLSGEEQRLTVASQRLQAKVEAFRVRKETAKASYTAAEASQRVRDAMADLREETLREETLREETGDPEAAPEQGVSEQGAWEQGAWEQGASVHHVSVHRVWGRGAWEQGASPEPSAATASADDRLREFAPPAGDAGPEDQDVVPPPPGMMVLLPGAPGDPRAGLVFVVESQDTAVLVAYVTGPGRAPEDYQAAARLAAGRLRPSPAHTGPAQAGASPGASSAGPAAGASPAGPAPGASPGGESPAGSADVAAEGAFTSYDAESFLDEFFPGAETEVEIAAGALVARSRAHTLAEARQRMRLTQAQVAQRMNVRQERVSAIERAEPGATEVRTLAAYVAALGGRLEIVAHVGDERILLR